MPRLTSIHQGKQPHRRHFLAEHLEERNLDPMEFLALLNEASSMDVKPTDKSQVYRWLDGQLPHLPTQIRIAAALKLHDLETGEPDPELLLVHPAHTWLARKLKGRDATEVTKLRQMIDIAFPDKKTGTGN